jgi:hypothetical protein
MDIACTQILFFFGNNFLLKKKVDLCVIKVTASERWVSSAPVLGEGG